MSSQIPSNDGEIIIQRTLMQPINPQDPPSAWRKFVNFWRVNIGLRSMELAERWGEAKVKSEECDVEIKLKAAQADYELKMAEVLKVRAEAQKTLSEATLNEAKAEVLKNISDPLASRYVQSQKPEDAAEWYQEVKEKIRIAGGSVEVELPDFDEQMEDNGD